MRMFRHLVLSAVPVLFLASCDPFDLVEPRPPYRQAGYPPYRGPEIPQPDRGQPDRGDFQPDPIPDHRPDNRPVPERYPVAERTANPNQVISPYAPYNVIDVTGYNPGQLVRDPTNNEIFRIP